MSVRRIKRYVYYRVGADPSLPDSGELLDAITAALRRSRQATGRVFKATTGFTHPRRIEILKTLGTGEMSFGQLRARTRISHGALSRHLEKLRARGLVERRQESYRCCRPPDALRATLWKLAMR